MPQIGVYTVVTLTLNKLYRDGMSIKYKFGGFVVLYWRASPVQQLTGFFPVRSSKELTGVYLILGNMMLVIKNTVHGTLLMIMETLILQ